MPIKGLTDRGEGFASIGDIRKGAEKTENRPGQDLEYFRVEFYKGEDEAAELFEEHYGKEPVSIDILFPFNEIDRCWDAWYEAYLAGAMVARADGEVYTYLRDYKNGEVLVDNGLDVKTGKPRPFSPDDIVATWKSKKKNEDVPVHCIPVGRLKVILPVLRRLAFLTVHTTSIHDIVNISEQLEGLRKIHDGELVGIPIVLKRVPKMISTPGTGGKRVRREKYLISLEADPSWVREKLMDMKRVALPGNGMPLLSEPVAELPEVVEGIVVEPEGDVARWTTVMLERVVKEGLAPDMDGALDWLNKSDLPLDSDWKNVSRWLKAFERGLDNNNGDEERAAASANKVYKKTGVPG